VHLRDVFSPATLTHYGRMISSAVDRYSDLRKPMDQRNTYEKAFNQVMNLWQRDETVKEFTFGKKLARIAAELMKVSGVRLYHDQALYKEIGGGITPWHADQYYWPLSNANTCTAWMPLQDTPLEMGPLAFATGSHIFPDGRSMEIGDQSEAFLAETLRAAGFADIVNAFHWGDVSFHQGWTFHHAHPNRSGKCREAMTVIYMEDGIRLTEPANTDQRNDWDRWMPGAVVGEIVATDLNPVLYRIAD